MRCSLAVCVILWAAAMVAKPASAQPSAGGDSGAAPPNFVFILIDDLRHDVFGHTGHPFLETPHIDQLASQGTRFSAAFVTSSLCSPARASLLTGRYMHNHGVVNNQSRLRDDAVTFAQLLQEAGYATAFVGKWHMGGRDDSPRDGFDRWVSFPGQGTYHPEDQTLNVDGQQVPRQKYMTDELSDYATEWLQKQDAGEPFLLYLSHKGVHGLYDPAPRHRDRYRDETYLPAAEDLADAAQQPGKPMWVHDQRNSWHGVEHPYHGRSGQTIGEMYRHYCEMVLSIDDSVGRVMQSLRQRGLDDNTIVIFTSDGGHLWGEHGLIDKRCAYEPSIRVPMITWGPGRIASGRTSEQLVTNIDVAPTLLELAGLSAPARMDGRSFAAGLTEPLQSGSSGDPAAPRSLLYEYHWEWTYPQTPTTFALRTERYKLIQYHGLWDSDELYDLKQDPEENENLIRDPEQRQRVARMRRQLHERLRETGGLSIPVAFKRGPGANRRSADGSKRAEFPPHMIAPARGGGEAQ